MTCVNWAAALAPSKHENFQPMLVQCGTSVFDAGPALYQHWSRERLVFAGYTLQSQARFFSAASTRHGGLRLHQFQTVCFPRSTCKNLMEASWSHYAEVVCSFGHIIIYAHNSRIKIGNVTHGQWIIELVSMNHSMAQIVNWIELFLLFLDRSNQ